MKKIKDLLLKELDKAIEENEVPVSCVIVNENGIVCSDHNKKIQNNDPISHAEILCIRKASKIFNRWNLNDCTLYCTLEPCDMCKEVIKEARIKTVYYILESEKDINNNTSYIPFYKLDDYANFKEKIRSFFKDKR